MPPLSCDSLLAQRRLFPPAGRGIVAIALVLCVMTLGVLHVMVVAHGLIWALHHLAYPALMPTTLGSLVATVPSWLVVMFAVIVAFGLRALPIIGHLAAGLSFYVVVMNALPLALVFALSGEILFGGHALIVRIVRIVRQRRLGQTPPPPRATRIDTVSHRAP